MEIYSNEEQQVEAIKRFWQQHGTSIIAGIAIGLAGLYAFRFYQDKQLTTLGTQSSQYTQLVEQLGDEKGDKKVWLVETQKFIEANPGSNYAVMAALLSAKEAALAGDLAVAEKQLTSVLSSVSASKYPEIFAVATLRLARVQSELGQYPQAIKTLEAKLPAAFTAQLEELRGDIWLRSGDAVKAKSAYTAAKTAAGDANNPLLQVKLNELAHVAG